MVQALVREIALRKHELPARPLETIYFGGGTPSLLSDRELGTIFDAIAGQFDIANGAEITLEANPDDLTPVKIKSLSNSPVNRLSIGIQSFRDSDLLLMNRAHNAQEAERSVKASQDAGFANITADLIYGLPGQSLADWRDNLQKLIALEVPHLSSYCLTIEPKTALANFVQKGKVRPAGEQTASDHFKALVEATAKAGFEHYEISNFARPGFIAVHNSSYWKGEPYLGIGPSAHSFSGNTRRWNVANNSVYLKKIFAGETAYESEELNEKERFNERVMLGLRTKWGVDIKMLENEFGGKYFEPFMDAVNKNILLGNLVIANYTLLLTTQGKFLSDGVTSDLFAV